MNTDFDQTPLNDDSTDFEDGTSSTNQYQDLDSIDVLIKTVFNGYSQHNDGIIPFKVVRDYLLQGKHEYPKILDWKREEVDHHLKKNYLPLYEEEEGEDDLISFSQTRDILRLAWTKQQIREVGEKLKASHREELVYLFMIGVPDESEPHQVAQTQEQQASDNQSNTTNESDNKLTSKNLEMKRISVVKQMRKEIYQKPHTWKEIIQDSMTKEIAVEAFKEHFKVAQDNFIDKFVFYFSGKGNEKGEWILSANNELSISEVLDLAVEAKLEAHINIESDTDYSGAMCFEAKKWFEDFKKSKEGNHELDDVLPSVKVQGNTHKTVKNDKGEYRKMNENQKQGTTTLKKQLKMFTEYTAKYGFTLYDSTKWKKKAIKEIKLENKELTFEEFQELCFTELSETAKQELYWAQDDKNVKEQ